MATFAIRDGEASDVEAVQAIYAHYVRTSTVTFEEEPPDVAEMLRRRTGLVTAGYAYLVAARAGSVLGYAYTSPYRPRSAYRFTLEDSVYVHEDHMREGVGRALVEALVARCRARPFKRMVAVIGDRSPPSIALHARLGFTLVGHLTAVGFKFGRWLDTTLMELDLCADAQERTPGQGRSGAAALDA
jgi:phosphinothricin acetyltransferase